MRLKRLWCILLIMCIFGIPENDAAADTITSLRSFEEALQSHAADLEEHFSIRCSRSLMNELDRIVTPGKEDTVLSELRGQAAMNGQCMVTWYDDRVELKGCTYYAGWRILCLFRSGKTEQLSDREQQTLNKALEIVNGASGSDLERERYIYDMLCQCVTYETLDVDVSDNDCAIGALVNGRADCDGYADAMMLCCGLANIPCRLMHGEALKPSADVSKDSSHMWNLVNIGGEWLITDVTWGDQETAVSYLSFNIGKKDARSMYSWHEEYLFTDIAEETDWSRYWMDDQQPITVRTMEDVYYAARETAWSSRDRLMLFCPDEPLWEQNPDTFKRMLHSAAFNSNSYKNNDRFYEVIDIKVPEVFRFCDSDQNILAALQDYADSGITSFTLYLNPSIAPYLFANECSELNRILSVSNLQSGYQYWYGEEAGSVAFSDVSFTEPLPYCSSEEDMVSVIRNETVNRPSEIAFLLQDGLAVDQMISKAAETCYSRGVQSMSYSVSGNRVTLVIHSYVDNYCLADTMEDALSYLYTVRDTGKTEARLYCSEELYDSLFANNAEGFFSLMRQAGITDFNASYNSAYLLLIAQNIR